MSRKEAAPCRHKGSPLPSVVDSVVELLIKKIPQDERLLTESGISREEFEHALPTAVETIRGKWAAENTSRRKFVSDLLDHLVKSNAIKSFKRPKYGNSTVYRLTLQNNKEVAVIQKGCPDGTHSSLNWERPDWADELYLWWLCSSQKSEPGEHIWKGVARVKKKISTESKNQLDGIIFFNEICGTPSRPCPKRKSCSLANGKIVPPPCIYVFPRWHEQSSNLNWRGEITREFPPILLSALGIKFSDSHYFIGSVGFRETKDGNKTDITSRYGPARTTHARG